LIHSLCNPAGTLIKGPNKEKLARPEPNAQVARDSYVVAITPDTTPEDIEALMKYVSLLAAHMAACA
jgi:hypothetical protein